jgi:hypothetical protein
MAEMRAPQRRAFDRPHFAPVHRRKASAHRFAGEALPNAPRTAQSP